MPHSSVHNKEAQKQKVVGRFADIWAIIPHSDLVKHIYNLLCAKKLLRKLHPEFEIVFFDLLGR